MKTALRLFYLCLLLQLTSSIASAQFPIINTTFNVEDLPAPPSVKDLVLQSDFAIIYSEGSYWFGEKIHLKLIGYKNNKWYKATFTQKKKNRSGKLKLKNADKRKSEQLVTFFDSVKFWTINKDSLNIQSKQINDSTRRLLSLSDGVNYSIDIISYGKILKVQAYEPDYYLKEIPEITVRKCFIEARDMFNKTFKAL